MKHRRDPLPPLRLERVIGVLPDGDAVRPLLERLMACARPDPDRRWTVSGELGTAAGRLVDVEAFERTAAVWVAEEEARLRARRDLVTRVARALGAGDDPAAVVALLKGAERFEAEGLPREGGEWAAAAARLAQRVGHPRTAEALRRHARCARAAGDLESAERLYEAAVTRGRDDGRPADEVIAATGRGNVAVDQGRWGEAEAWYRRGLDVLRREAVERSMDPKEASSLRWRLCQNLGITSREQGDLDGSEAWYVKAEADAEGLDDPAAVVEIENGRGQLALARGEPDAAEVHFRVALDALPGTDADQVRVAVRANLADALLRQGRSLDAGRLAREAEAEAIRGRHVSRLPEVYRVLAQVARARGTAGAFILVERALEIIRDVGLPAFQEMRTLLLYADMRGEEGDDALAAEARARAAKILEGLQHHTREQSERGGSAS